MACLTASLVFLIIQIVHGQLEEVTVTTGVGAFIGFREEVELDTKNVTISKFLGIPYAEPPVGDLRFRKPITKTPLTEPLKVQKLGSACLQSYMQMFPAMDTDSEDCLFLNIFKPKIDLETGQRLPVMVWIHGGAFILGSSNAYVGDALAANGPVIVVTINYRVSLWGFLSTEDQNSPGNYGLWDQHLAIQWVHNNIAAFGGDPRRVTIFGESAGSGSVIFQGLFPGNRGLFQRIIAQSGTAAATWAIRHNPKLDAVKLATLVGCDTQEVGPMLNCLRKVPADQLNSTINDPEKFEFTFPLPFVPTVDGDFVPVSPSEILDASNNIRKDLKDLLASFDLMIGLTSGEGGAAVTPFAGVDETPENFLPNKTFFDEELVPTLVKSMFGNNATQVMFDAVRAEYTDWDDPENPESIRQNFCMMHSDASMLGNIFRTTKLHARMSNRPTYQYCFNLLPYKSIFSRPSWFKGSLHGDDLLYMFGNKMDLEIPGVSSNREFQDWEKKAADDIMTLWTNFAKTGNPNEPRDLGVDWLPYTMKHRRYMEILNKVTESRLKERLRERKARLWDEFLPALQKATTCQSSVPSMGTCDRDGDCPP